MLYLGPMTIEHADWKKKLCKKNTFPVETFIHAGKKLYEKYMNQPRYTEVFREEDLDAGVAVVKQEGFQFVVVSSLNPSDYVALLEESIPLGYCYPFVVY